MLQKSLLVAITLFVSACGWQLRDQQLLISSVDAIYFASTETNTDLIGDLKRALDSYGVRFVDIQSEATYSVSIVAVRENIRTVSINSSGRVAEYQLNEDVDFYIRSIPTNNMYPLTTASSERVYEFREEDILSSDNEEKRIRYEMRKDIVAQILARLGSVSTSNSNPDQ
ncbi:MAG: LPS assembly lipoprotein LptE [Porticoccaceae bacterium]|nr:LPS assembly lipoprotein LptE [Porticoccaceae bacterium]MDG1473777.1 LPS assembly lipoprotein LptE [Porticoccaceae bacterium]